jgi:hypothetical protein
MSTTFNEEYQKVLGERGLALVSKRSAIQMKLDAEKRRDDLEEILFGNTDKCGIVSVLSIFYNQIWLMTGKASSKPVLHDPVQAKSQYQSEFSLSVTPPGDGAGGLHPPEADNPNAGQNDVDPNSIWLTNHALESTPSGTGVIQLLEALAKVIGVVAVNGNGRGPYTSQVAAQEQAALDRQIGMLGSRTENSEIYSTGTAPNDQWLIGQNGIDNPDNYTLKSNLISALTNVRDKLNSLIPAFEQESIMVDEVKGAILQEFKVELPNDPDLPLMIWQVEVFIKKIEDYINYFNKFSNPSPSANRAEINSMLSEVLAYTETIATALNDRVTSILSGMLGNASSGTKKYLTFWVSEVVTKPDGPYSMILAANDMLEQAQINLTKNNSRLNFFSADHEKWIENTTIQSLYDRAVMELDQATIKRWETDIIWNIIMSVNKYKVLVRPLSQIPMPLSNDPWDDSSGVWITDKLPTSYLRNILTREPPIETTFFRLIAYDTSQGDAGDFDRMDGFNTKSKQSDIVSDNIDFSQLNNTQDNQSVIEVDASAGLKERDFLLVNGSDIAQIMAITDNQYALDLDYGAISQIQALYGLYYKEPSSGE